MPASRVPPSPPPSLAGAEWLSRPSTQRVLAVIAAGGYEARVVGGSVRNALIGKPVGDIDIATTARPEITMRLAAAAGLRVVPTGLAHGTVTVIADHHPFEVTTLRRDVETFGRHAVVAFTDSWQVDAARRDFTINALYCAADGTVHDPLGGYGDLEARRVRFIGNPAERIAEDYLRILRFFRFFAEYAVGAPDDEALSASTAARAGLGQLSGERLHQELTRLLKAPRAIAALEAMADHGILTELLAVAPRLGVVRRLAAIEKAQGLAPSAPLRLAALAIAVEEDVDRLAARLRLSNAERDTLLVAARHLASPARGGRRQMSDEERLYREGPDAYHMGCLLAWAGSEASADDERLAGALRLPARWQPPRLPVGGSDVLALGLEPGPAMGRVLARLENWWIAAGFTADRQALEHELERLVADEVGAARAHLPSGSTRP